MVAPTRCSSTASRGSSRAAEPCDAWGALGREVATCLYASRVSLHRDLVTRHVPPNVKVWTFVDQSASCPSENVTIITISRSRTVLLGLAILVIASAATTIPIS